METPDSQMQGYQSDVFSLPADIQRLTQQDAASLLQPHRYIPDGKRFAGYGRQSRGCRITRG